MLLGPRWLALCALWSIVACASSSPPAPAPSAPSARAAPAPPPPPKGRPLTPHLQSQLDRLILKAEELRALPLEHPIDASLRNSEELSKVLSAKLAEPEAKREMEEERRSLVAFGLIEPDYDLSSAYHRLLLEQIAGYYDSSTGQLNLVEGTLTSSVVANTPEAQLLARMGVTESSILIVHELVHALQDQHFSLEPLLERSKDRPDANQAVRALIEGDATVIMLDLVFRAMGVSLDRMPSATVEIMSQSFAVAAMGGEEIKKVPLVLRADLLFPYVVGFSFVMALRAQGGNAALDEAFSSRLPQSTEQVLHPERFFEGDRPHPLSFAASVPQRWSLVQESTAGEFAVRTLFQSFELPESYEAAAGWGGDRYRVLARAEDADALSVVWTSSWDSPDEAKEFEAAMRRVLERRGVRFELERRRHLVFAVWGDDLDALMKMALQVVPK